MFDNNFEYAKPDAASLMQSLRAFGYDVSTAIADLIDNSITAKASTVAIQFEWNNGSPWITIADNGYGMSESELYNAMKTGSKSPLIKRDESDLGRFGLGLKTASLSQCKRLTVASKQEKDTVYIRCWDLDVVTEYNDWILLKTPSSDATTIIDEFFSNSNHGTIVIWEKIDRIVPGTHINDEEYQKAFLAYASAVKKHISLVFSSYMRGNKKVDFYLNNRTIDLWDPFMTDNPHTTKLPSETLYVAGHEVYIHSYILPHSSKLSPEEYEINAGIDGWTAQQGFYIYRNNRLIVSKNWLIPGMQKLDQFRLARIRIDIGNETDNEWNIDVRKSVAVPPVSIQKEIKRIAISAQRESTRVYRHRGKTLTRKGNKERSFVWHQKVRHGKLGYSINRDHPIISTLLHSEQSEQIKQLLTLIEETIPVPMIISDHTEKEKEMLEPFYACSRNPFC